MSPWLNRIGATLVVISLVGGCSPEEDRDRTGDIGNEQGILDRDVEDFEDDPRQGPGPSDD